ncbi:MAG: hypothetical protein KBA31_03310 [Alphaproteobacteria bacterium]|nr:hypothetical protein [Alphaproteobacteria bacterium]
MTDSERQREIERLYRQAFAEYGTIALWNMRPVANPGPGDAKAITEALRVEGDLGARKLAFELERLCGAA